MISMGPQQGVSENGVAAIVFVLMWQLEVTDPVPYEYLHLHGPHTHGAGAFSTEAERAGPGNLHRRIGGVSA